MFGGTVVEIWLKGENGEDEIPFLELLFSFCIHRSEREGQREKKRV